MRTFIYSFIFGVIFASCSTNIPENIEYIDFSHTDGWHGNSIKIKKDSFNILINECDSIGFGKGKFEKIIFDSIQAIANTLYGNLIDTNYEFCCSNCQYYQIIIRREKTKIIYYGGDCKKNQKFDQIKNLIFYFFYSIQGEGGPSFIPESFISKIKIDEINQNKIKH